MSNTNLRILCLKCGEGLVGLPSFDSMTEEMEKEGDDCNLELSASIREHQETLHALCCPKCNNPVKNSDNEVCTWLPIGPQLAQKLLAGKTVKQIWTTVSRIRKLHLIIRNIINLPLSIIKELLHGRIGGQLISYIPLISPPDNSLGPDLEELRKIFGKE